MPFGSDRYKGAFDPSSCVLARVYGCRPVGSTAGGHLRPCHTAGAPSPDVLPFTAPTSAQLAHAAPMASPSLVARLALLKLRMSPFPRGRAYPAGRECAEALGAVGHAPSTCARS
jgi:hypothetical protein